MTRRTPWGGKGKKGRLTDEILDAVSSGNRGLVGAAPVLEVLGQKNSAHKILAEAAELLHNAPRHEFLCGDRQNLWKQFLDEKFVGQGHVGKVAIDWRWERKGLRGPRDCEQKGGKKPSPNTLIGSRKPNE